jgi:hypothetical protein
MGSIRRMSKVPECLAWGVSPSHPLRHLRAERKSTQALAEGVYRNRPEPHFSHRLAGYPRAVDIEFHRPVLGIEYPRMVDLGEIVILGGQPEDRHSGNPLAGQLPRQARGRERFVDRVSRAGKQAHLLARHYGHGIGF